MLTFRRFRLLAAVLLPALALNVLPAHAQDDAVAADRPGFGDGSAVVAPGRFQAEAGYNYSEFRDGDFSTQSHTVGQVVLRYGLSPRFEVRALLGSLVLLQKSEPRHTTCPEGSDGCPAADAGRDVSDEAGFQDVAIGGKVNLIEGSGTPIGMPNVTAILDVGLPVGSDAFTSDALQPTAKLALDLPLINTVGFSANAGYSFLLGDGDADAFLTYASLGAGLPAVAGLGVFVGVYGLYPPGGTASHGLDGGLTYLPNPATQLDLNVDFGLTDSEADFTVGAGIARRF